MASLNALVPTFTSALVLAVSAGAASAHISLDQASTHKSRYGDGDQKIAPCGRANGVRSDNVYEYAAGETITVEFKEFIPHPGYFRFAFDPDGDDDFVDPVSIKPIDPNRPCPFNAADKCGESDFYNDPAIVLPGMDNLEPHLAQDSKGTYSFQVKLPDVECDNCTLQLIQVMEDTIHGAYNTVLDDPADVGPFAGIPDVYHLCIDLKLTRPPGSGAAEDDSGCSVERGPATGTASVLFALGLAGLIGVRRRR